MSDRTVHVSYPGMEIVRYDRAGKWYLEPTNPTLPRQKVTCKRQPMLRTGAVVILMFLRSTWVATAARDSIDS